MVDHRGNSASCKLKENGPEIVVKLRNIRLSLASIDIQRLVDLTPVFNVT
jgi:hypothetical protein